MELIESQTASGAASVDFTDLSSDYAAYLIVYCNTTTGTDNVDVILRTSSDNGSTFDNGAAEYTYLVREATMATTVVFTNTGDDAHTNIVLYRAAGNATNEDGSGFVWLFNPSATTFTSVDFTSSHENQAGTMVYSKGAGTRLEAAAVDAIQILASSGTISGVFKLYGVNSS